MYLSSILHSIIQTEQLLHKYSKLKGKKLLSLILSIYNYQLPVLSAKHNDSESKEINVIEEYHAKNRPMSAQEAEIRWKKTPWSAVIFVVLSDRSKDSPRSPVTVPVR